VKLTPRYKLILVAVGLFLGVAILAAVLVFPQFGKLADLDAQLASENEKVSSAETLLEQRRQAKDNAAITDAGLMELAAAMPENPELPALIIEMQDVAYDTDVQLLAVKPGEPAQMVGDPFIALPIEIQVGGSWADTVDFVQSLERMTRQLRISVVESGVLSLSDQEELVVPTDVYAVGTKLSIRAYTIPVSSSASGSVPPAPAAPAQ